ncbi:aminotransferase class IV [Kribbella sp. NBC_00662]|uniref:aminotransferase class IV n=1 Tax=Kribbella sp. NBC_00662 TaxID=2975969 RepID=UPI00324FD33B
MTDFLLLDGGLLRAVDPVLLRATTFGHFTSMQVRDGKVDGLDLHFDRLDRSTREVFGEPLSADRVRADLRAAVDEAGSGDLSIRVNVFATTRLHLLVRVGPPVAPATDPIRLATYEHERSVPHLKHTGTFDLTYHAHKAQQAGYDNALSSTPHPARSPKPPSGTSASRVAQNSSSRPRRSSKASASRSSNAACPPTALHRSP